MTRASSARELVIWGSGGHARELCDLVAALVDDGARWRLLGLLDDDVARHGHVVDGLEVLGGEAWLRERPDPPAVAIGIGSSRARAHVARRLAPLRLEHPVLVHPTAIRTGRISLAAGVVVAAGAILTTGISIGEHTHVNVGTSISHDCELADFATVGPGSRLAGGVRLGTGSDLGAGVVLIPSVTVGAWSLLGAGTVVTRDLPANVTAVGVPARIIRERPSGWELQSEPARPAQDALPSGA